MPIPLPCFSGSRRTEDATILHFWRWDLPEVKIPGRNNGPLEEIEGAEEELKALEKRFNTGKFLTGNDATESNFKLMAPDFDIIHLAIHGMGDIQKNFAASLYFRSENDSLDDGELHAYELYGLKLKPLWQC